VINNGVDHVVDTQPDLSAFLQDPPDGDAQGSLRIHGLAPADIRARAAVDFERGSKMLAEKFFLYLEALIKSQQTHSDGSPKVISTSPHVPIKLPAAK
jgi:hypothetical protein